MAIIVRIFSNSLGNVYQKNLTIKNCNPLAVNAVTYLFLSILCVPLFLFYSFSKFEIEFWLCAIFVGILGALGNGCLVKALQDGELSVLGPINSYKPIFAMIFALVFLKEIPSIWGCLGIVLILSGSYFLVEASKGGFIYSFFKNKSVQFRFWALLFCSIEAVLIKKLILLSSIGAAFVVWCYFGAIFSFILLRLYNTMILQDIKSVLMCNFSTIAKIVVCIGLMQFTTNCIFKYMDVAYALSIFQLSSLVSILLGYKLFQEKNIKRKFLGAIIMVLGAILIIMYN